MSLEKDIASMRNMFEAAPRREQPPHPDLGKRTPIVKADWDCEVIPTPENLGGYGFTLIIYKNGEEILRKAGFGAVSMAQLEARDHVLLEEFGIDREVEE